MYSEQFVLKSKNRPLFGGEKKNERFLAGMSLFGITRVRFLLEWKKRRNAVPK